MQANDFVLSITRTDFDNTLEITLKSKNKEISKTVTRSAEIDHRFNEFKTGYWKWAKKLRYSGESMRIARIPSVFEDESVEISSEILREETSQQAKQLINAVDKWLKTETKLKEILNEPNIKEEINQLRKLTTVRLFIKTNDPVLKTIPWEQTNRLNEIFSVPNFSLTITSKEYPSLSDLSFNNPLKVLVILGSSQQIDIEKDRLLIEQYFQRINAQVDVIENFSSNELRIRLTENQERTYDIVFFSGHSFSHQDSDGSLVGNIDIGETTLASDDLEDTLKRAANDGLKLFVFNSCDGLGLGEQMLKFNIPYVVVMRQPIHDEVAHIFLEHFLKKLTEGHSLENAVRTTNNLLNPSSGNKISLTKEQVNPHWLAVIYQNENAPPFRLPENKGILETKIDEPLEESKTANLTDKEQVILQVINIAPKRNWWDNLNNSRLKWILLVIIAFAVAIAFHFAINFPLMPDKNAIKQIKLPEQKAKITHPIAACNAIADDPDFSCGEKNRFNYPRGGTLLLEESKGRQKLAEGHYGEAAKLLRKAWENSKDPTNLIGANNAAILRDIQSGVLAKENVLTIGVAIPYYGPPEFIAKSHLAGVAKQQEEANQKKDFKTFVIMGNDANDADYKSIAVARQFTQLQDVVGVVGHYASRVTFRVKNIYQEANLPLISPTATSSELSSLKPDNVFFRVTCTTKLTANKLVNHLVEKNMTKVAIFFEDGKKLAVDFRQDFLKALQNTSIKKIGDYNLAEKSSIAARVAKAKEYSDQTALILIPDAYVNDVTQDNVLEVIQENNGELLLLGFNTLIYEKYLENSANMLIALPWLPNQQQKEQIKNFWAKNEPVTYHIGFAHDALSVFVEAIYRLKNEGIPVTREDVRKTIANKGFKAHGITEEISFDGSDRAENLSVMARPDCGVNPCTLVRID